MHSVSVRRYKTGFIILVFLLCHSVGSAQTPLAGIERQKIDYPPVIKFLDELKAAGVLTFDDIQPSLAPDSSTAGYHVVDREYVVKDELEQVWNHYINAGLQSSWNSDKVHLGFTYSRQSDSVFYANDTVKSLIPGLIVFFDLDLLFKLKSIAMAFEVTKIDPREKLIEFSYIKGNSSQGKQQMFFETTSKGYTLITHVSYYKSKPKPREGLYPHVHTQLINRFHRNMKRSFLKKKSNMAIEP